MAAECNRCGDCCDPVHLSLDAWLSILGFVAYERENDLTKPNVYDAVFVAEHWHAVEITDRGGVRLRCDAFDPETRLCTARDERPPICRNFPWYGSDDPAVMAKRIAGLPRCSYIEDVPVEIRPREVTNSA